MVKITAEFDPERRITSYRIAATTPSEVDAEIEKLLAALNPNWARFTPPILWGREFVAHGELSILTAAKPHSLRVQTIAIDGVMRALF